MIFVVKRPNGGYSLSFKWRLAWAAYDHIELKAQRPFGLSEGMGVCRNQMLAASFIGDAVVDGVERQQRVARKIHLRHRPLQKIDTAN